ncbi:XdhC family protein [Microbacterium aquimaris]|uniref:XdhC family protein n=1 Tax=Microbacterium aquimaris TaxID=459816 RepID=A0ABU5N3B4_9MICO|nr:XdhC/CoxI family protein [Microbacterium aquimaris]MDZ8160564.1 XdhC family protein [Microbacterium aquimaris]
MLGLGTEAHRRLRAGERLGVVTVIGVPGSAPRGVGASMAVTASGAVIGSISGGCVEADAVVLARLALSTDSAHRATYGLTDDDAPAAGLACGGRIEVLAYPVAFEDPVVGEILEHEDADRAITIGLVVDGPDAGRAFTAHDADGLPAAVAADLARAALLRENRRITPREALAPSRSASRSALASPGELTSPDAPTTPHGTHLPEVVALSRAPRPRLIIAGGGEHAAALCRVATAAGFAVTVVDMWEVLVTKERFPEAARRVVAPPHEYLAGQAPEDIDLRTAVCILTHDERLDIPALEAALALPIGFVGALGARRTVARRTHLLVERGVPDEAVARIHMPLGLDLGGHSPDETAIAALAEIVAARHGGTGAPLRETKGPLHDTRGRSHKPAVSAEESIARSC